MSSFERYLTLWVALCIVVGVALGHLMPGVFHAIGGFEVAKVNLPVAVLIWLMIIPMLIKIDFAALAQVRQHWRGIGVTLFINWAVKPFSMAWLAWLFVGYLFRPYLPAEQINSYIAGLIILAAAPCTAMVFVWSNLTRGRAAFYPEPGRAERHDHGLRLRADRRPAAGPVGDHSALEYADLVGGALHRPAGHRGAAGASSTLVVRRRRHRPVSVFSAPCSRSRLSRLLVDAGVAIRLPGRADHQTAWRDSGLLAVPILIQVYFNSGLAYLLNRLTGEEHCVAGPSALIGASNFFELAVAAAISLFGFNSGAALATVVGVLGRSAGDVDGRGDRQPQQGLVRARIAPSPVIAEAAECLTTPRCRTLSSWRSNQLIRRRTGCRQRQRIKPPAFYCFTARCASAIFQPPPDLRSGAACLKRFRGRDAHLRPHRPAACQMVPPDRTSQGPGAAGAVRPGRKARSGPARNATAR